MTMKTALLRLILIILQYLADIIIKGEIMSKIKNHNSDLGTLKDNLTSCRNKLFDLLDQWHYMQNVIHPRIMFKYEQIFGEIEFELRKKNAEAERIEKWIEEFISQNSEKKSNSKNEFSSFKNSVIEELDQGEFSKIYRKIVKALHPDLNGRSDEFNKYWDNIQKAYKNNDLTQLKIFEATICDFKNIKEDPREELIKNEIRKLQKYISEEETKLRQLKFNEPYCFENKLNDSRWIINRRSILHNKLNQTERKLEFQKKMLSNIASRNKSINSEIKELIAS